MSSFSQNQVPILILGGGIQGVSMALGLKKRAHLRDSVWILDPNPELLHYWYQDTRQSKVQFLRSSISHSIAPDFHSLRTFALARGFTKKLSESEFLETSFCEREEYDLLSSYLRPSIKLFNTHAKWLMKQEELEHFHLRGTVTSIEPVQRGGYRVNFVQDTIEHQIHATILILALGQSRAIDPTFPSILNQDPFELTPSQVKDKPFHILGGGLSGCQLALWALDSGSSMVTIYDPKPPKFSRFDFDPCFIGPKCKNTFHTIGSARKRISLALNHKFPGTLPKEIFESIQYSRSTSKFFWNLTQGFLNVHEFLASSLDGIHLRATGFIAHEHALGGWMKSLPTYLGYPLLDLEYQWNPGLFVIGSQAISAAGPAAGNIIGAHLARRTIEPLISSYFKG